MTELKKRDAPIPAESAEEARPWRLPFWTEPPVHAVEREPEVDDPDGDAESHTDSNDSHPDFPTAEELEAIRREAYNAGLEQGLVEERREPPQPRNPCLQGQDFPGLLPAIQPGVLLVLLGSSWRVFVAKGLGGTVEKDVKIADGDVHYLGAFGAVSVV